MGIETGILLSPRVWEASGHVGNFIDPLCECEKCRKRVRADHRVEELDGEAVTSKDQLVGRIGKLRELKKWSCPYCKTVNSLGDPKEFNLLFSTTIGPTSSPDAVGYLRPETAQGAYINLNNVATAARKTILPFGIGQVGTVFRNEVSPSNFIFRTREFEQMELQWFCDPETSAQWHDYWINECVDFCIKECGLKPENFRIRKHEKTELAHYSLGTSDLEFLYPFGWGEFWGIANRGDHDLKAHQAASKTSFLGGKPCHIVEPSLGLNRLFLAVISNAYYVEPVTGRTVLRFSRNVAPFEVAVFPIVANNPKIMEEARKAYDTFAFWDARVDMDEASTSVGKKYRRHDEIGTPVCVVVDDMTLVDGTVTLRDRDSMKQMRVRLKDMETRKGFEDAAEELSKFA